ncbi:type III pantothenate kinase [Bacillus horti]|uniref:Type III pantothenate kinase n=1 Tax=Caldalkalibacillus horti TaxID=77523 RepID=A0ABT9W2X7_9BACI|nr:type III pantothenate kinase [Bacillus horti]MDQ0167604.1 type III pantothenate kinase [Bacillus horti]
MILVIDVGNTNIVVGVYKDDQLLYHWRINTNKNQTEDEYGMLVKGLFREEGLIPHDVQGIIISSVVPPSMSALERMCVKYFNIEPLTVGPGIKTGLPIQYDNPREVGADRIVNAVGALVDYEPPLIIVDSGTATTFCYIDEKGCFQGGAIAPGMNISMEALYHYASKLPKIEFVIPKQAIGKNTVSSMQSGTVFGYIGLVDGLIERMIEETKTQPTIIATGGLAKIIADQSKFIQHYDPFLTLKGLYTIYHRNV